MYVRFVSYALLSQLFIRKLLRMDTTLFHRAEAIRSRLLQLRDSL